MIREDGLGLHCKWIVENTVHAYDDLILIVLECMQQLTTTDELFGIIKYAYYLFIFQTMVFFITSIVCIM